MRDALRASAIGSRALTCALVAWRSRRQRHRRRARRAPRRRRLRSLASLSRLVSERRATHRVSRGVRRSVVVARQFADARRGARRADARTRRSARRADRRSIPRVTSNGSIIRRNTQVVAIDRGAATLGARLASVGSEGFVLRSTTIGGKRVDRRRGEYRRRRAATARSRLLRRMQTQRTVAALADRERAAHSACACSITGTISIAASSAATPGSRCGIGIISRIRLPTRYRDYARAERVDRHQRRVADERECEREGSHAPISREGRGARRTSFARTAFTCISPRASARRSRSAD